MKKRFLFLGNSILLLIMAFILTGCEVKNPTDGVEVKLRAPFEKKLFDNQSGDTPELEIEPKAAVLVENHQFSSSLPKQMGKSKSSVMSPNDSGIELFETGMNMQEFWNTYLQNPNKTAMLFTGTLTNNSLANITIHYYMGTSQGQKIIMSQVCTPGNNATIQIPFGMLAQHKGWFMSQPYNYGVYLGIKIEINGPYDVTLNSLTLHTPPFIYIHRIVNKNDFDDEDMKDFNLDELNEIEVDSVDITGKITNNSYSDVTLKMDLTYLDSPPDNYDLLTITRTLPARTTVDIKDLDLINNSNLEIVQKAVQAVLEVEGAEIDFEIFCYSVDMISPISITIDEMTINTLAMVSQTQ